MKRISLILLSLFLIISITTGCSEDTAKDYTLKSFDKQQKINKMSYDGKLKLNLTIDEEAIAQNEELSLISTYLIAFSQIEFDIEGKETMSPSRSEMILKARTNAQGMELAFDLPIMIKDDIMYFKLPDNFSFFMPGGKQYISIDMTEAYVQYDQEIAQKDSVKMMKAIVNSIDDTAFSTENINDYQIDNVKIDQVISITLTQENIKPILKGIYKDALPIFMKQIEMYSLSNGQNEQAQDFKDKLNKDEEEFNQFLNDLNTKLKINDMKITNVYDDNGYQRKTIVNADLQINTEEMGSVGLNLNYDININKINQDIKFEVPIPDKNNVIDIKELEATLNKN